MEQNTRLPRWNVSINANLIMEGYTEDEMDAQIAKAFDKLSFPPYEFSATFRRVDGKPANPRK